MEEKKITLEQLKKAVLEDLKSVNPENTILKMRLQCRDSEDWEQILEYYDYSPYMDTLYKRFTPDVEEYMQDESKCLIHWYTNDVLNGTLVKSWWQYRKAEFSEENLYKKFYFELIKYVEIGSKMTILYSAYFSLHGDVIGIDDPTGYYRGFDDYEEDGYTLSENEQVISQYMEHCIKRRKYEDKFNIGDILYVDGNPLERPFYAVYCGERKDRPIRGRSFLYINNIEIAEIVEKYNLHEYQRSFYQIGLSYKDEISPFYKIEIVESCPYKCLMKARELLREASERNVDVEEKWDDLRKILKEDLEKIKQPILDGNKYVKEITDEIVRLLEKNKEISFMEIMSSFCDWVSFSKGISFWQLNDERFLSLFSKYAKKMMTKEGIQQAQCISKIEEKFSSLGIFCIR